MVMLAPLLTNFKKVGINSDKSEINRGDEESQKSSEITSSGTPISR